MANVVAANLVIVDQDGKYFANTKANDFAIYTPSNASQQIYIGVENPTKDAPIVIAQEATIIQALSVKKDIVVDGSIAVTGTANFAEPVVITEITADIPVNIQGVSFSNTSLVAQDITFSNNLIGNYVGVSNVDIKERLVASEVQNNVMYTSNIFVNRKFRLSNKPFIVS